MTIYVVQAIVLVGGAFMLVALQQERIGAAIKRVNPHSLPFRLGLAYPLARRSRTGLTVAMYALVVFILTFITTISHMIGAQAAHAKAGVRGSFGVVVSSSSSNPIRAADLMQMRGARAVAPLSTTTASFTVADTNTAHTDSPAYVVIGERRGVSPT